MQNEYDGNALICQMLCDAIDLPRDNVDFSEPEWYLKHKWDHHQEFKFACKLYRKIKSMTPTARHRYGFTYISARYLAKTIYNSTIISGWAYSDNDIEIHDRRIAMFISPTFTRLPKNSGL